MQLEYTEQDGSSARLKKLTFSLPAMIQELSYGEAILRINSLPDNTLVIAREDGLISFWSPQLQQKRSKMVFVCMFYLPINLLSFGVMQEFLIFTNDLFFS